MPDFIYITEENVKLIHYPVRLVISICTFYETWEDISFPNIRVFVYRNCQIHRFQGIIAATHTPPSPAAEAAAQDKSFG